MKMRVVKEDLAELNDSQLRKLNDFWKPALYDLAIAKVCKDADTLEYDEFEYIVGHIDIDSRANIFLFDLMRINELTTQNNETEVIEDDFSEEAFEEDFNEEDFDCTYFRPSYFRKDECIPLFNIGQMIDILQKNNFGSNEFYLSAVANSIGCEIGKNTLSFDNYGNDYEPAELCNVLWESVKSLL